MSVADSSLMRYIRESNIVHDLREFFTDDCVADYTGSLDLMKGVDAVMEGLQKAIGHVSTFHGLTTQAIYLTGKDTAEATTYCSWSFLRR
jgi:hypothetical protein